MTGLELIINFEDDRAYLTTEKVLLLKQLGLPETANRFYSPASWNIRVLSYNTNERRIFAEILSYRTFKQPFPLYQSALESKLMEVENMGFRSIDTYALLRTLKGGESQTIFPSHDKIPEREKKLPIHTEQIVVKTEPFLQMVKETYFVPLKKISFKSGHVSFNKRIPLLKRIIEFTVANDFIREEFEAVKHYFSNVLNTKKIQFDIVINLKDNEITNIDAKSPEIDQIDESIIESVKYDFVRGITKKKIDAEIDKALFTMDEFIGIMTDEKVKAIVFYENEKSFIEDFLKITNTKHYNHLRFLSRMHAHSIMKLRFVIKPFSFIFLIEGEKYYYIIWETLDTTEATYIWYEDKNLDKLKIALKKIDHIIKEIKVQGKTLYMNKKEDNFRRIYHDYSEQVDGFIKWKFELESVLI